MAEVQNDQAWLRFSITKEGTVIAPGNLVMAVLLRMKNAINQLSSVFVVVMIALFFGPAAHSQSVARLGQSESEPRNEPVFAMRAITALKRLDNEVLIYRSLGEFEENGKLARVPFPTFKSDFQQTAAEVEPVLTQLTNGKLRTDLLNALDSYRDGAFWWGRIDRPRVVHVSSLVATERTLASPDAAFIASLPYTVAIHWRQARKYLHHAEELMSRPVR